MDDFKKVIPQVIEGIGNKRGDDFFQSITLGLALAVEADYTFIAHYKPATHSSETIALYKGDQLIDNFEYALAGTPCHLVTCDQIAIYKSQVCHLFPDDQLLIDMGIEGYVGAPLHSKDGDVFGIVVALYQQPINDPDWVSAIFQFFSGRISAEMENVNQAAQLEKKIEELNAYKESLEKRVEKRTRELSLARDRAEAASAVKDNFLATMSHEIRTPMNGVLGMTELLQTTELNEEQKGYLESLNQAGETMMTVINDILDYSKLSAGETVLDIVDFSAEQWLNIISQPYRLHSINKAKFSLAIDKNLPPFLKGDIARLHQVLNNLLNNAVKFTPNGEVKLEVTCLGFDANAASVNFSVTDTGIGIAAENLEKIFSPFSQEETSTFRNFGGTGLGLPICKSLVEAMGGTITATSERGVGSRFEFTISMPIGKSPSESHTYPESGSYQGVNVLLAEDNKVNQLVAKGQLSKLGISLTIVGDGVQALEEYTNKSDNYDLILMDCEMPNMNGYEAARKIRDWEHTNQHKAVPIFALTAHILDENTQLCLESGMTGKLHKPIKISDYPPLFEKIMLEK